ncbi:hypothetical protein XH98_20565 [Bradyrhizobium sp. CCBAU 51745]|nr:hypothetical protein [Bradyrhizobium sp. CCBAU 51745]
MIVEVAEQLATMAVAGSNQSIMNADNNVRIGDKGFAAAGLSFLIDARVRSIDVNSDVSLALNALVSTT